MTRFLHAGREGVAEVAEQLQVVVDLRVSPDPGLAGPRRVAFVDGTLRTEARLTRTGADGDVSMGPAGSWAAGAVRVDGDEPARFDQVRTGRAAIFTGGRPVQTARPPRRMVLGAVRGRRGRRRIGASASSSA